MLEPIHRIKLIKKSMPFRLRHLVSPKIIEIKKSIIALSKIKPDFLIYTYEKDSYISKHRIEFSVDASKLIRESLRKESGWKKYFVPIIKQIRSNIIFKLEGNTGMTFEHAFNESIVELHNALVENI